MLSLIIASDWLCALSAEIAEESAPVRLIIELRMLSGRDADDVARADGNAVHRERGSAGRRIDAGDDAGDGRVVEDRVADGVGRGHRDRVLTAVGELIAARVLAIPGEGVGSGISGSGAGPHRIAGGILDGDRYVRRRSRQRVAVSRRAVR